MPFLVESPEQELQFMIGRLTWDAIAMRSRIEYLEKEVERLNGELNAAQPAPEAGFPPGP